MDHNVQVPAAASASEGGGPSADAVFPTTKLDGNSKPQDAAGSTLSSPLPPTEAPQSQHESAAAKPSDHSPTAQKSVTWSSDLAREGPPPAAAEMRLDSNPYVSPSPAVASSSNKKTMETVKNVLSRWGKKIGDSAKKAEDLSRNTWQHLKTAPSFTEAAMGRIAQGTKVIAEGGYEKIFRQTFETLPEEHLKKSYACYLSTSAGPVMGILYLSSAKIAFCSDSPLSYKTGDKTEWSYYKVVIPLHQLRAANPSESRTNSGEKYIQIVSVDNHEFWFMGFVKYNNAVQALQATLQEVHDLEA